MWLQLLTGREDLQGQGFFVCFFFKPGHRLPKGLCSRLQQFPEEGLTQGTGVGHGM